MPEQIHPIASPPGEAGRCTSSRGGRRRIRLDPRRGRRLTVAGVLAVPALVLGTAASAAASTVTVASWGMDDTGTSMTDSSGHHHTGTLHSVTTGASGFSGKSFGFFGSPSYVSVPSATDLNPGTAQFAFTVHVKFGSRPSSTVGDYDVLRKGLSSSDGGSYKVEVLQSGRALCDFRGSTGQGTVTSASALSTGSWHTITCKRTSSAVQVTVDGSSTSKTVTTGSIANTGNLYIGAKSGSGADQYKGYVDSVSIRKG